MAMFDELPLEAINDAQGVGVAGLQHPKHFPQVSDEARRQDVAAHDPEIGWRRIALRFFDEFINPMNVALRKSRKAAHGLVDASDTVAGNIFPGYFLEKEHRRPVFIEEPDKRADDKVFGNNNVVAEADGNRSPPEARPGLKHGVAVAKRRGLRHNAHPGKSILLFRFGKIDPEARGVARTGHHDHALYAAFRGIFQNIINKLPAGDLHEVLGRAEREGPQALPEARDGQDERFYGSGLFGHSDPLEFSAGGGSAFGGDAWRFVVCFLPPVLLFPALLFF